MEVGESASAQREEKKRVLILFLLARGSSVKGVEQPKGPHTSKPDKESPTRLEIGSFKSKG